MIKCEDSKLLPADQTTRLPCEHVSQGTRTGNYPVHVYPYPVHLCTEWGGGVETLKLKKERESGVSFPGQCRRAGAGRRGGAHARRAGEVQAGFFGGPERGEDVDHHAVHVRQF